MAMPVISRLFATPSARRFAALLLVVAIAPATHAQIAIGGSNPSGAAASGASAAVQAVVLRARVMADVGEGPKGRQLLDSLVRELPRESNDAAEALYWRALLSEDTASAELDWKRIVVESPLSPRASEALLRLSELNLTRYNPGLAQQNVQQLLTNYPDAPERPRALLVLARLYFDERDAPRACGVLTAVRKDAPLGAVEVRLQADEMQQQCRGVREVALGAEPDAASVGAPVGDTAAARVESARIETARAESARKDSVARAALSRRDSSLRAATARRDSIAFADAVRKDSTTRAAILRNDSIARIATARADSMRAVIARDSVLRDSLRKVYAARDSAAGMTMARDRARRDSATRVANTVDSLAALVRGTSATGAKPSASSTSAKAGRFTVQVAAYKTRAQANTLAKKLNANKLNAFVAGTRQPFRVNVGRYATRAEATEALAALKKKGQSGFVVEVPPA